MEQTLTIIGFAILLVSWFAMFARLRGDARRAAGSLTDYIGPRVPLLRRSGLGLVLRYGQVYGLDVRLAGAVLGLILIGAAILVGVSSRE